MTRFFNTIGRDRQAEVAGGLDQTGALTNDYLLLITLSCVIATFGLVLDSAAVIIGAMLIAPLMSPILRCALALVQGELSKFGRAFSTLLVGVLLSVLLSAVFGTLVSTGSFNFLEELPPEVLGRTRPNLFDLVIALAGGTAAAYALAQPQLSAALPGVAIATALMPPLCTVGIGVSQGRVDVSGGALLLFLANFMAIMFASSLTFLFVGFRPRFGPLRTALLTPVILLEGALVLLIVAVLSGLTIRIIRETQEDRAIRATLAGALAELDDTSLVHFERQSQPEHLTIVATVRSPRVLSRGMAQRMQRELAARLQHPIALKLLVIPVTSLDPLAPPTITPAAVASAPTAAPPAQPTPSRVPQPAPTAAPTIAAATPPPPAPTAPPTALPTPSATPVSYAVVGATGGLGLNLRRTAEPGAVITALRDGTLVQILGRSSAADGSEWVEVVLPDGRVGWVAGDYLVPYQTFVAP